MPAEHFYYKNIRRYCQEDGVLKPFLNPFFYKMSGRSTPIPFVHSACISVKVQLVHPKENEGVFRLPLFFIGILITHTQPLHDCAASGVIDIVRCRNIGDPIFFQLLNDRPAGFCCNPLMPKRFAKPIAEIIAVICGDIDIADGEIIFF